MNNIQYTRYEYIIEKLRNSINDYYRRHANENMFQMYLANGEQILYTIPESAIAHLLGVNTNYLNSTSLLQADSKSSIDVLKKLCMEENVYYLYDKINKGYIDIEQLFSQYLEEKINAFSNNIQPNIYQMEFVCKIDKNKCYNNGVDPIPADYLLCSKDNNDNYLVLGICKNNYSYVAITNQIFMSLEELKESFGEILKNQELTFISRLVINSREYGDYKQNFALKPNEKCEKSLKLEQYKDMFEAHVNISYEYQMMAKQNHQNYTNINSIIEYMTNQTTITTEMQYSLPYLENNLKNLIDAYNNIINSSNNGVVTKDYSIISSENTQLKNELLKLKEEVENIISINNSLVIENEALKEERDSYKEVITKANDSFQKTLTKYSSN